MSGNDAHQDSGNSPPRLEAAFAYLHEGYSVIPLFTRDEHGNCSCGNLDCEHPGKHPCIKSWKLYQQHRPTAEEVHQWWQEFPKANIGIILGSVSAGLVSIDVDDPELAELLLESKIASKTWVERSPRGGLHIYVKETQVSSSSKELIPGKYELRAEGQYAVCSPSVGYLLISSQREPIKVADAKVWAKEQLQLIGIPVQRSGNDGKAYKTLAERVMHEGEGRNNALTSLTGLLRHKGYPIEDVMVVLRAFNQQRCSPPLSEGELSSIIQSAEKWEPASPTTLEMGNGEILVAVELAKLGKPKKREDVIEKLVPKGYLTIIHGDGGNGKSYKVLHMATCVVADLPFCGFGVQQSPTLYIDWELDEEEYLRRAREVALGLGLPDIPEGLFYCSPQDYLTDEKFFTAVKQFVQERHVRVVVLDSLGVATGGQINQEIAKDIISLLARLRKLDVTIIATDHESHLQREQLPHNRRPFGSVYKFNLARSLLHVQKKYEKKVDEKESVTGVVLRQIKRTSGLLQEPIRLRLIFGTNQDGENTVRIELDDSVSTQAPSPSSTDRVEQKLKELGQATVKILAKETSLADGTVTNAITLLKKHKPPKVVVVGKNGRAPIYAPPPVSTTPLTPLINNNDGVEK